MKKILTIALLSTLAISLSSCYGGFSLTKKVYTINGSFGNKWINSILMIIPGTMIYPLTATADALVLNAIEFWTGANPIAEGNTLEQQDMTGNKLVATKLPGGALELTSIKMDGTVNTVTLTKSDEMVQAYDANGKLVAQVSAPAEDVVTP